MSETATTRDQDLQTFVQGFREEYPEDFLEIDEPVSARYETQAILEELEASGRTPITKFNDVDGNSMSLISNVNAGQKQYACALGVNPSELHDAYASRLGDLIPPVRDNAQLWGDVALTGGDVDLGVLPVPTHYTGDGGPYLTASMIVACDPETGVPTFGYHRCQVKDSTRLGVSLHSRRRMFEYFRRAEERGQSLPAAICIGLNPLFSLGALSYPAASVSKFDVVGGLMQEPVRTSRCGTIDLDVPSACEVVIEGEIVAGVREPEGPFGEFTGYSSRRSTQNVFKVNSINMRRDAWFQSVGAGLLTDHLAPMALGREVEIRRRLAHAVANVTDVAVPSWGCGSFTAVVGIRQTRPGEATHVIPMVLGVDHNIKTVIVVDEDIDVRDTTQVLWAINTRMQPDRDLTLITGSTGSLLDPSTSEEGLTAKLGIDATRPIGREFGALLNLDQAAAARAKELVGRVARGAVAAHGVAAAAHGS